MNHEEKAMKIFWDKFNCSQAVLGAFAEELGMPEEQAMQVRYVLAQVPEKVKYAVLYLGQ